MIKHNYSLLPHNSFGFDIVANMFLDYSNVEELVDFLKTYQHKNYPILHIGKGCNLLFTDNFAGIILHSSIKDINILKEDTNSIWIRVGAGIVFDDFCRQSTENNMGGIENLSLIPSQIGAAAIQNIGAYGAEIKDVIIDVETIEIISTKKRVFSVKECLYDYRNSIFKDKLYGQYIVTHVLFRLNKNPKPNLEYAALGNEFKDNIIPSIQEVREAVIKIRSSKLPDPDLLGNAGSFFKNPYCHIEHFRQLKKSYPDMPFYTISEKKVKLPAAYLIEQCGFKGKRIGNVGVYEKQPLVLVNYGGASPKEIIDLAQNIELAIKNKFNITLEREVIYV